MPSETGSETGSGTGPRSTRRAGRDRHDILLSASAVIAERGFNNARFSDVAERAGTSISTLQYLFGNREDLIVAAIAARIDQYLVSAQAHVESIEDPLQRLRWLTGHLAAADAADEKAARENWLVWVEFWHAALRDEELYDASVRAYTGWRRLFSDAVTYAVEAGVITAPPNIDHISEGACGLADGLGIQIAVGHPGMTWQTAGVIIRRWLALVLGCPQLADED